MKNDLFDAAQQILNARDFCGNESKALFDWQADNRKLTPDEKLEVWAIVSHQWRKSQFEAGAKVLNSYQRRIAYASL